MKALTVAKQVAIIELKTFYIVVTKLQCLFKVKRM